ncbi:putative calcium-binding protein CML45 [Acorus gramineus]|uniref:Calcium-binding protein CML45 n=1 Tax=Acorus gramineus TaxID=55184 RepID=A0AAV9AUF1_ACOGR|nr:putative calcium-binding protein CML45 [Acorus gramineus]
MEVESVVGFILICQIINYVFDFAKLYSAFAALFLFKEELFRASSKLQQETTTTSTTTTTKSEDLGHHGELRLRLAEVEEVMERLGFACDDSEGETSTFGEFLGSKDLSTMFEEKEPSLEEVREAFRVFDDDKDGFIGAGDLQRVLTRLGFVEGVKVEACEEMIEAVGGGGGDGRIDFNGFVKCMENSFC